ncbi:hypothetical protein BC936DRAFT_142305 [Jimgerdemannia flammicorona]|uniref:Tudor domain-containing protein n=1 Tax=Jimgerdemannia flammicorona TaxID=994334 RepID=A0A433A0K4_9FUNG|nr:hypothetical protein BC936DRAFT_142305 [Jimgerdemannia flammicorona]
MQIRNGVRDDVTECLQIWRRHAVKASTHLFLAIHPIQRTPRHSPLATMNAEELAGYRYQLQQVEEVLSADPTNAEMLKLKTDLTELIALTAQYVEQERHNNRLHNGSAAKNPYATTVATEDPLHSGSEPASPTTTHTPLTVGSMCLAKWSVDGKMYPATVTAVGGSDQVYSVVFKGYTDVEIVRPEDVRPMPAGGSGAAAGKLGKRESVFDVGEEDKRKKKPKRDKNAPKKVAEEVVKQKAWLNFATKTGGEEKKKKKATATVVAPINKKSIFKTPDNPEGKVGVVGSGRGMTQFAQRGKHVFEQDD